MGDLPRLMQRLEGECINKTLGYEVHRHVHLMGGLADFAKVHPPDLVTEVLTAVRESMLEEGYMSSMEMHSSGPVPIEEWFDEETQELPEFQAWDDVNGGWLIPEEVIKARAVEIDWVHKNKVYEKRTIAEAKAKGAEIIPLLWIDTNKGDDVRIKYRSRLVGIEKKRKNNGGVTNRTSTARCAVV